MRSANQIHRRAESVTLLRRLVRRQGLCDGGHVRQPPAAARPRHSYLALRTGGHEPGAQCDLNLKKSLHDSKLAVSGCDSLGMSCFPPRSLPILWLSALPSMRAGRVGEPGRTRVHGRQAVPVLMAVGAKWHECCRRNRRACIASEQTRDCSTKFSAGVQSRIAL